MQLRWHLILCLALVALGGAQTRTRQNLAEILGFENGRPGVYPAGWGGGQSDTIFTDDQIVHSGKYAARIERSSSSSATFSSVTTGIPRDFAGKTIVWRGFVRTENVSDAAALWLREDGDTPNLAFATSQGLRVNGTTDWTEYAITLPVVNEAKQLFFGFLLSGTGKAWVDDLQLQVDGRA